MIHFRKRSRPVISSGLKPRFMVAQVDGIYKFVSTGKAIVAVATYGCLSAVADAMTTFSTTFCLVSVIGARALDFAFRERAVDRRGLAALLRRGTRVCGRPLRVAVPVRFRFAMGECCDDGNEGGCGRGDKQGDIGRGVITHAITCGRVSNLYSRHHAMYPRCCWPTYR